MLLYPLAGNEEKILANIRQIGCDFKALPIFRNKLNILPVKILGVKAAQANIIKQEMLSAKGDAVVHAGSVACAVEKTDVILLGTPSVYRQFMRKMEYQNTPTLVEIGRDLKRLLDAIAGPVLMQKSPHGREISYDVPKIMGILNTTPDSFYDGGRHNSPEAAVAHGLQMAEDGASIIDVGGESTRPGSEGVSENEEMERVIPVVKGLRAQSGVMISVDTTKARVARAAIEAGADMVNDISALRSDPDMAATVSETGALCVLMHMQGQPKTMQDAPAYQDIIAEEIGFFAERLEFTRSSRIEREKLILDPGIGFGKTLEHNIELIQRLESFLGFGLPVLMAASRKSMVGMLLGDTDRADSRMKPPEERLYGTLALHAASVLRGASIIRVHDVKAHAELLKVLAAVK